jgi:uncharacterized repeat protein (TIGR01451 family)
VFADAQAEAATGDGLKDGRHAARADFRVAAATLSVAKYSRVVSDPFSGAASPRAIPGAVVEYCIVISNAAGAATADSVIASDAIPASLTYVTNSVFLNGTFNGTDTCTDTGGAAGNDGTNVSGSTVSNNFGSVAAPPVSRSASARPSTKAGRQASGWKPLRWFRNIPRLAAALAGALLAIPGPGHAQTLTNTARATWVQGGEARSATSNTVTTAVEQVPLAIDLFHPEADAAQIAMTPSLCGGEPLNLVPGNGTGALSLPAAATSAVNVGEILLVRVTAPLANRDAGAIETLTVTVTASSGDTESLTIFETEANSGVFAGAIRTASIPPTPVAGDCRVSVHKGDTIRASLDGLAPGESLVSRSVGVLADPFGLVFDSIDGTPVSGARVTVVDAATGLPAPVFAEDGVTPWPSTVLTGEEVTDAAGNRYPMAPGEYRFPLMAFGTYALRVEPPSPYSAPSAATPAALAALTRPDGRAYVISEASFGRGFALTTPDAVRIDIPLDRPNIGVTLTKSASRTRVQPGDTVFYTLTVANPDRGRAQRAVRIVDTPSPWLRLRPDTLRIAGRAAP